MGQYVNSPGHFPWPTWGSVGLIPSVGAECISMTYFVQTHRTRITRLGRGMRLTGAAILLVGTAPTVAGATFSEAIATCDGLEATIMGTAAADVLQGTPGDDVIVGLGGNDTIKGLGGNDTICAGAGADTVRGGPGNDTIFGQKGSDDLRGDAGKDFVSGATGADQLRGGKGNDTLEGGSQADKLEGNGGRDTLRGQNGNDEAKGGGGNDTIRGNAGADELVGGAGTDTCRADGGFGTAAGCEAFGAAPTAAQIIDFGFVAANITVSQGTTVVWTNTGDATHTTIKDGQNPANRSWDSGSLAPQQSFAVTYDVADTYSYICSIHPFMAGSVTVSG